MAQRINEQVGMFTTIESKTHFFQVGREMLRADPMPRSHNAALQERKCVLDGVGVNLAVNIDLAAVIDGLVLLRWDASAFHGVRIGHKIVGDNHVYIFAHVLTDELRNRSGLCVPSMKEAYIAVALPDANDCFLIILASLDSVTSDLSTNVRFVHFDHAIKHRLLCFAHRGPDSVAEIPCGFVSADPERALNLEGADTLLSFDQEKHGHEPSGQRQMRIVEDRARSDGELIATLAARELLARFHVPDVAVLAAWTGNAFGPAEPREYFPAIFVGSIELIQLRECHRHESTSQEQEAQDRQAA